MTSMTTTGVSAATGFSRTLRTLQLWLVSLPGQGLGMDQMLGPGGRALVDRMRAPQLGLNIRHLGWALEQLQCLEDRCFFCGWAVEMTRSST